MKKLLAILLALTLVLALAACGGETDTPTDAPTDEPTDAPTEAPTDAPTPTEAVDPEELPANPLNHWDFESAEGLTTLHQITRPVDSPLTGVGADKFELAESKHEIIFADGPVGKAVYLDGEYGIKLDMTAPTDDSYTIAFWYNGDRFITFGPIITMGRNMGLENSTDPATAVAWFNFTSTTWGPDGASITPVAWNRNSSFPWAPNGVDDPAGVFPWVGADTVYGKKEWVHVALVVDGNRYTCLDDNGERVGTKLYLNGQLFFDASAENQFYQGVAPEIFQHIDTAIRGLEAYVGINYWDACYKGFVDDLYVYDEALTAGQVLSLYNMGDASVTSTAPEYTGPHDDEMSGNPGGTVEPQLPEITPDASALDAIGAVTRDNGFWSDTSAGYELKDGASVTMKLKTYSDGVNVYDNPVFAYSNTAVTTDKVASADNFPGYAEYGVTRVDGIDGAAWGDGTATFEKSWTDDAAFMEAMKNAEVTAVFSRAANVITVDVTIVSGETTLTEKIVFTANNMAADAPCFVHVTNEHCYTEILSVE